MTGDGGQEFGACGGLMVGVMVDEPMRMDMGGRRMVGWVDRGWDEF